MAATSSVPVVGTIQPLRSLLAGDSPRALWLGRAVELLGDWTALVALLAIVYRLSGSVPTVALFLIARVAPRALVELLGIAPAGVRRPRGLALTLAARVPFVAALALVSAEADLWWAAALVAAGAALTALSDGGRASLAPRLVPRARVSAENALNVSIERVCFLLGSLLGALLLSEWREGTAFVVAAALIAVAAIATFTLPETATAPEAPARSLASFRGRPLLVTTAMSLFVSAAVATGLLSTLALLATGPLERGLPALGALLAAVALGMVAGPLPVPKLLNRLPVPFLLAGSAASLAAGMAVISQLSWLPAVAVILFLIGLCAITNDITAATAVRRSTRDADLPGATRLMRLATLAGQLAGAGALALLAGTWDATNVLLGMGVAGAVVAGLLFVALYGRYYVDRFSRRGAATA